jgi:chemotaxis signal transduction protein
MRIYEHFSEEELAILRARTQRIAASSRLEAAEEALTVLMVKVHTESYALPIEVIDAVYADIYITPVPNVPSFALGITNIRGHLVFVLDLGTILGLPGVEGQTADLPVIALESDLGVAFQVDAVEGIERLATATLTNTLPNLALVQKTYLQGLSPDGKALLNVQAILDDLVATNASA